MNKKSTIKHFVDKYIDSRKRFYQNIRDNGVPSKKLKQEKHAAVNKIFSMMNDQEYDLVLKDFQGIVSGNQISGCTITEMERYMLDFTSDKYITCLEHQKTAILNVIDKHIHSPLDLKQENKEKPIFKPKKLKGFIQKLKSPEGQSNIYVDYGGRELKKILNDNPVSLDDCDIEKANSGNTNQQICMAQAYLSINDCENAKKWTMKVFDKDPYNEYNEPVLDLLGIFETFGECISYHDEL